MTIKTKTITVPVTLDIDGVQGTMNVDIHYVENYTDGVLSVDVCGIRAETNFLEDCFEYDAVLNLEQKILNEDFN